MKWWTDPTQVREAIARHGNPTAAARALGGISARRLREIALETGVDSAPSLGVASTASASEADYVDLVSADNPRGTGARTPEDLLREAGLDPDDWIYTFEKGAWDALAGDGQVTTLERIGIRAMRKPELLMRRVLPEGWEAPIAARPLHEHRRPLKKVLIPDPHVPLHEPQLIEAIIAYLEDHADEIDEVIFLGDVSDASPFKRHTGNPRTDCTVEEHQVATVELLARVRRAVPGAKISWILGNHDLWHIQRIREQMPQYEQLRRPIINGTEVTWEEFELLSVRSIFALDDLRVDVIEAKGEYHDGTLAVMDDLVALHGVATGVHAAIKEQAGWEGTSVVQAHAHKAEITAITKRLPNGTETQRYAINAGTSARRDLGYSHKRDCAQCFLLITHWEDERWHPELALFDPQTESTTMSGWRYDPA